MMRNDLERIFGGCKNIHGSQCVVKSPFCELDNVEFYIEDTPSHSSQPAFIVQDEFQPYHLKVNNSEGKRIVFIKSDKCLFDINHIKKCDCILYSEESIFFVELSNTHPATRNKKRRHAVMQLATTIELLRNAGISFSRFKNKFAVICFKRDNNHPVNTSANSQKAIFKSKYAVDLVEGNSISF